MTKASSIPPATRDNPFYWPSLPDYDSLPPEKKRGLTRAYERAGHLSSPAAFAEWASDGYWKPYKYLGGLSEKVVDFLENDTADILIVEVPVRHGKSELLSIFTPAWLLCRYPDLKVGLTSYEATFAADFGRKAREVMTEKGPFFDLRVKQDSRAADRWNLDGYRGGMWTAGAGGPITGKGAHVIIVDDPIKNDEQAESQLERDKLWRWWQRTLLTRREPGGKIIVIMSRWHVDDLTGRLIQQASEQNRKGLRIERFHLPAIAEEDDPLGRKPGEALCPERYPIEDLLAIKEDVGSYAFSSLFQQNPVPAEGGLFQIWKLRHYSFDAVRNEEDNSISLVYYLGEGEERKVYLDSDCWRFATVDLATTAKQSSDWTVVQIWDVTVNADMVLVDQLRLRADSGDHMKLLEEAQERYKPGYFAVESGAYGSTFISLARRAGLPVIECKPDKDKVQRARTPGAVYVESGKVWVPHNAPWVGEFIQEMAEFPNGAHDDQVDAFAYAALEVGMGRALPFRKEKPKGMTFSEKIWALTGGKKVKSKKHIHDILGRY